MRHVNAAAFYQSQAIHYGLPAMGQLSNVIEMLKRSFKVKDGEGTIAIPAALVAIRRKLQEEYESKFEEKSKKDQDRIASIKNQLVAIQKSKETEAALRKELEDLEGRTDAQVKTTSSSKRSRNEAGMDNCAGVSEVFVHEERRHRIPVTSDRDDAPSMQKRPRFHQDNDLPQKLIKHSPSSDQTANPFVKQGGVPEEHFPVLPVRRVLLVR